MIAPKMLKETPKALKVLIKKTERLREHLSELLALCNHDKRQILALALRPPRGYRSTVAANSATGRENPLNVRRNSAPIPFAGAFFTPANSCYGGRAWAGFGLAGFLTSRFLTPRTAATLSREKDGGSSSTLGALPMKHALNPSRIRAAAHRAMAMAALRANSSAAVRLRRYNHHMSIARGLDASGGAK